MLTITHLNLRRLLPGRPASSRAVETTAGVQPELAPPTPSPRPAPPLPRARRSLFGWLLGENRRRESVRLVQGELRLQNVRPIRNDFRDDDTVTVARPKPTVLWETPRPEARRDDQDHAWNRLRGRRPESLVVKAD